MALLLLNLSEESFEITDLRHISLHSGDASSYALDRRSQLLLTPTGDEDVCPFGHEALRGSKTNPGCSARDKCDLSLQLARHLPVDRHSLLLSAMTSSPICSSFLFLPLPRHPLLYIRRAVQNRDTFILAGIEKPNGLDVHKIDLFQIQYGRLSPADLGLYLIEMVRSKLSAQPKSNSV